MFMKAESGAERGEFALRHDQKAERVAKSLRQLLTGAELSNGALAPEVENVDLRRFWRAMPAAFTSSSFF